MRSIRCHLVAVVLGTLMALSGVIPAAHAAPARPPARPLTTTYSFYGAYGYWMDEAIRQWPQQQINWCGVADIQAIDRYAWQQYNNTIPSTSQQDIANLLNSGSAVSPWGRAYNIGSQTPAFAADIAADGGTDPRAIAWGAWDVTPNGYYFHNYIYSPYQGSTNNSATYQVGSDFGPAHGVNDPVSITIDDGKHSLIEDGVWASSDPSAGGETISSISLWDSAWGYGGNSPGYLGGSQHALISLYDWENSVYNDANYGSYNYWKYPYDAGDYNYVPNPGIPVDPAATTVGRNTGDPDPNTQNGTYYTVNHLNPSVSLQTHWENAFVTIEQDYVYTCSASPNYALDRYGNLAPHNGSTACG